MDFFEEVLRKIGNRPLLISSTILAIVFLANRLLIVRAVSSIASRLYLHTFVVGATHNPDETQITVSGLYIHPVKSLRPVSVKFATLDTKGFVDDRRYMLVTPAPLPAWGSFGSHDPTHRFLTQRQCLSLATVVAELQDGTLRLSSFKLPNESVSISVTPLPGSALYRATLWSDMVQVRDMGEQVAAFMQKLVNQDNAMPDELKDSVRVVTQDRRDGRIADDKYVPASARTSTGRTPSVALTDGFPILLACEASLDELNRRLQQKGKGSLPMSRFRPNIVLSGTMPFEEDHWKVIAIDGVLFHIVKGCPRCKQSCTDQQTGDVTDEPLATMAEFRALQPGNKDNLYFAQNVLSAPGSNGKRISVGARVQVLQRGDPVWEE
jgi:uncharacterized protein YcbX